MLVIIPFTNDFHNGEELRFCIRSLVRFFTSMTGLVVVGTRPTWYVGDFIHAHDVPARKEYSMYAKTALAAKAYGVDRFLHSCDDYFALKPFDETLPNYYSKTCKEMALNNSSGRYRTQYKNCPDGWLNFDVHTPIIMTPFSWGSDSKETDKPIKSTFANQFGLKGIEIADCKFKNPHTYEKIKEIIKDRPFFSTSPFCMNTAMKTVLEGLYPEKSIYEN